MFGSDIRLTAFLPFHLAVASDTVSKIIGAESIDTCGLTMPEWRVMAVLADSAPLSQIDLVRVTWMDKVAVNRACKALHNREYLRRSPHASDRRSHRLELSDEGLARFEELWPSAHAAYEKIFAVLNVTEIEFLHEMSEKLLRSATLAGALAAKVCASRRHGRRYQLR